ncbi:kinase-like protein [Fistulina hepatica ATCC 64428]|uniref:cAMP-dependent protein kinase n=1 Tax=Fistulina hepatica ATCC 64428 TaxID=1128425 RepID=A0A0D7A583_9AGAR|nr:kinase-like protein [Fistulina hepatica ATCC 64428]
MIKRVTGKLGIHRSSPSKSDAKESNCSLPSPPPSSSPVVTSARTSVSHPPPPYQPEERSDARAITAETTAGTGESLDAPRRVAHGYKLSDFAIERTLGKGTFGRVHLVMSRHNGEYYAMKVLRKQNVVDLKQVAHTNNEQHLLHALDHVFITKLWVSFQDAENLYMVMDFVAGGELFSLLRRCHRFPEGVAKFYSAEVALALNFLHTHDIIYRDLKPENVLINWDGHIKIADFGFAKVCCEPAWTLCGTPDYLAPEIVHGERYNKSVDWYALGVLIYEMIAGFPPFYEPSDNNAALYQRIQRGTDLLRWPPQFTDLSVDLIVRLMDRDPTKRLGNLLNGAGDLFKHEFYAEVTWHRLLAKEIVAPFEPRMGHSGDTAAFDIYPEDDWCYGRRMADPYGHLFANFEYACNDPLV